jgi:hypothetical protein
LWEGICDCGKTVFVRPDKAASGKIKSCGCYNRERMSKKLETEEQIIERYKNSRKYDPRTSSALHIYKTNYSDGDLTFEEFLNLSQFLCYYCGSPPSNKFVRNKNKRASEYQKNKGEFVYNGLDRIDSNISHNKDNLVPCCCHCNRAKSDYSIGEFLEMVKLICEKHFIKKCKNEQ